MNDDLIVKCLDMAWNVYFDSIHTVWRIIFVRKSLKISREKHFEIMKRVETDEIQEG